MPQGLSASVGGVEVASSSGEERQAPAWTIGSLLDEMTARGSEPAVFSFRNGAPDVSSFEEIAGQARCLTSGLVGIGVRSGDPVLLFGPSSVDWIIVRLALGACGALPVGLDDLATDEEVRAVLEQSRCRRAFCAAKHVAQLRKLGEYESLEIYLLDRDDHGGDSLPDWRTLLDDQPGGVGPVDPSSPAMLLYTSGTTGVPKGFTLSCDNIGANVRAIVAERLIGPGDRLLLPLPLHHAYPQVVGLFTTFTSGAAVVLPESVAGPKILEALRAADASGIIGVPRLYTALSSSVESQIAARGWAMACVFNFALKASILLRRRFGLNVGSWLFRSVRRRLTRSLRLFVSGGARLDPEVLWTLIGLGWDVRSGYGLAETSSIFTGNLPGRERLGSEGRPFSGGRLRIAGPDERGVGEIQLSGPSLFTGYLGNPAANRAAFTDDGWFRTGDLGYLDRDGFLYVTGRSKEVIVLGGGKKIVPEELEGTYAASPYIAEIAILERSGALVGLIVADLPAIRASGFTRVEDVLRVTLKEVGRHLPSYQRLAGFAMASGPLPRTRLGKIRRFLLPGLYDQTLAKRRAPPPSEVSEQDRALLQKPEAQAVWNLMASRYPVDRLSLDADLELDLGVDSLEWIALSLELQRRLGVDLDETEIANIGTVRDLLRLTGEGRARAEALSPAAGRASRSLNGARWLEPTGSVVQAFTMLLYLLNRLLVRIVFRLETNGLEALPGQGAFVLVANHCSDLDPLVVAAAMPWRIARRVYWGGDAGRLFSQAWAGPLFRAAHVFPVDGRLPALSLSLAGEVLKRGSVLVWFPEEWRSPTGELQPFQPGIGWILADTPVPAVPAFIEGTFEALPRHRKWPGWAAVSVRFGPLIERRDLPGGTGTQADPKLIAESLHAAVAKLDPRGSDE